MGALDVRAGETLRERRSRLLQRLAAHRAASPLQPLATAHRGEAGKQAQGGLPWTLPPWDALPPALRLGLAAAAGGAIVALRPWRLMRRAVRWMAPVVSMELRARLWQHAKQAVGGVLREAVDASDRSPPR
ncbi:MAG: hypothetical protein H6933_01620 [Burkholderiaceae bacterium]|nr:hypothetical protein [Burkholderiaceae bacterium]